MSAHPQTEVVSIVIPARNAAATIGAQLTALASQASPVAFELIVVDSASGDNTGVIAASFEGVRVVRATEPGANRARNLGINEARGEVILLCDADDVVQPGWISALYSASQRADYFGGALELTELNSAMCRETWGVTTALRMVESPGPYPAPMSCNCGFGREMWVALGGFDENLAVANDEYEFFWRAGHQGFTYSPEPAAVVAYRLRAGARAILTREFRAGQADVRTHIVAKGLGHQREKISTSLHVYAWIIKEVVLGVTSRRRRWDALRIGARRFGRLVESSNSRTLYL